MHVIDHTLRGCDDGYNLIVVVQLSLDCMKEPSAADSTAYVYKFLIPPPKKNRTEQNSQLILNLGAMANAEFEKHGFRLIY
jgi:hypothetical protein